MTALEALVLLVEAVDAQTAKTWTGNGDKGYVKIDWIDDALTDARRVLAEERCESAVG